MTRGNSVRAPNWLVRAKPSVQKIAQRLSHLVKDPDEDLAKWVIGHLFPFETPLYKTPYMNPGTYTTPVRCMFRSTFITNTTGLGWVGFAPSYAVDDFCVNLSGAAGTSSVINYADAGTGTAGLNGSPYGVADFTTSGTDTTAGRRVMARWCKCAFRIQNITPAVNRGGVGFMGATNGGGTSANNTSQTNYAELKAQGAVMDVDVNGAWNEYVVTPANDEDYKFGYKPYYRPQYAYSTNWEQTASGAAQFETENVPVEGVFAFINAPSAATPQTYVVEIIFDWEYIAPGVSNTGGASFARTSNYPTDCPAHNNGTLHMQAALAKARQSQPDAAHRATKARSHSFAHKVGDFFKSVGHDIAKPLDDAIGGISAGLGIDLGGSAVDAVGSALSFAFL